METFHLYPDFEREPQPRSPEEGTIPFYLIVLGLLRQVVEPLKYEVVEIRAESGRLDGWSIYKKGFYPYQESAAAVYLSSQRDEIVYISRDRDAGDEAEHMIGMVEEALGRVNIAFQDGYEAVMR